AQRGDDGGEEANRVACGGCAGDHDHKSVREVTVAAPVGPATGMVLNLKDLDRIIRDHVVDQVDHKHLNRDVEFLRGVMPTAENLAVAFWGRLEKALTDARLRRVRLVESENNAAEVVAE